MYIAPEAACVDRAPMARMVRRRSIGSLNMSKKLAFCERFFSVSRALLDVTGLFLDNGVGVHDGPMPAQRFLGLLDFSMLHEPARRLWDEEEGKEYQRRDDKDDAKRYLVGLAALEGACRVVDDGADESADGRPDLKGRDHQAPVFCQAGLLESIVRGLLYFRM